MAETWFTPKEWKSRLVEFAGRRLLRNVANGETVTYDVSRSEGQVSQEGDAFNTKNMNDLEQRISNGFANAKTNIDSLNRDLNQRFPDGTGLQWDGTNFWGTTADGMKVKLGSLTYRDFTVTPTANSGSMSIDISDIPNYKDLILWETLFPRMLSDLDMANWNTSMLRTGVGYDWNYDADKGILSISSRHTECVLIQYGTGLKQRTVRVHYI
mgnify:CR=1 FL=1